jgi:hypothetical protein
MYPSRKTLLPCADLRHEANDEMGVRVFPNIWSPCSSVTTERPRSYEAVTRGKANLLCIGSG